MISSGSTGWEYQLVPYVNRFHGRWASSNDCRIQMTIAVKPQVVALHRIALERSNAHPEHCTAHHLEKCILLTDLSGSLMHGLLPLARSPLKLPGLSPKICCHMAISGSRSLSCQVEKRARQMVDMKCSGNKEHQYTPIPCHIFCTHLIKCSKNYRCKRSTCS